MVAGFVAGLSEIHNIGDVVVGTVIAAALLTAVSVGWRRITAPRLVIECGNTREFNVPLSREPDASKADYAKLLIVRERGGRLAERPEVTIEQVTPIPPNVAHRLPETLQRRDPERVDLEPHNHLRFILQQIELREDGNCVVRPAVFSPDGDRVVHIPGDTVYFTVKVRAGDSRRVLAQRDFRIVNPWPQPFGLVPLVGPPPGYANFPFPSVYEN